MNNSAKSRILALSLTTAITLITTAANAAPENAATTSFGSPIVDAADFGDISQVQNLMSSGTNPNEKGDNGATSLMRAVYHDNAQLVNILLKSGASADTADVGGATALSIAAREGNNDVLDLLVSAGANLNLADKQGYTPLMRATVAGNLDGAKSLITAGAQLGLANNSGQTALAVAKKEGRDDIQELLEARGANTTAEAKPDQAKAEKIALAPLIKLKSGKSTSHKDSAKADDGDKADIVIDFSNGRLTDDKDSAFTPQLTRAEPRKPLTEDADYTLSGFSAPEKLPEISNDKEILTNLSGNNVIEKEVAVEKADKNWLGKLSSIMDSSRTPYDISANEMVYKEGSQYNLLDLGNFKDEDFANKKIAALKQSFPDVFGSLSLKVIKKGSGSGTFFQVNAGVIDNHDKATDICKKLIAAGTNCRPVETRLMSQDEFNKLTSDQPPTPVASQTPPAAATPPATQDANAKYPDKKDVLGPVPSPAVEGKSLPPAPAPVQVAANTPTPAKTNVPSNNIANLAPISEAGGDKFLPAVADMPAPKLTNNLSTPPKVTTETETVTKTISVTPAVPAKPAIVTPPAPVQIAQNIPPTPPAPKAVAVPADALPNPSDNAEQNKKKIEVTEVKKTETVTKKPDEIKTVTATETTKTVAPAPLPVPPVPASMPSTPPAIGSKSAVQITPPVKPSIPPVQSAALSEPPAPVIEQPPAPKIKSTADLPPLPGTPAANAAATTTPILAAAPVAVETTTKVETKKTETKLVAHASDETPAPMPEPEKPAKMEVKVTKSSQTVKVEVPNKPVSVAAAETPAPAPLMPEGPIVQVRDDRVSTKPQPEALHISDAKDAEPVAQLSHPPQQTNKFEVERPVKVTEQEAAPVTQLFTPAPDNSRSTSVTAHREIWAKVDSFNDQSTAQGFWNTLRTQNGLTAYRMRTVSPLNKRDKVSAEIGPFAEASEAQQLCSLVTTQGYTCKIHANIPARFNDILSSSGQFSRHSELNLAQSHHDNYTAHYSNTIIGSSADPMSAAETATGTAWAIQLGTYETPEAAEAQWNYDSKKSRALKKLSKNIVPADGKFHLRAGSFASADAADNLCSELRAKSVTCILVRS